MDSKKLLEIERDKIHKPLLESVLSFFSFNVEQGDDLNHLLNLTNIDYDDYHADLLG